MRDWLEWLRHEYEDEETRCRYSDDNYLMKKYDPELYWPGKRRWTHSIDEHLGRIESEISSKGDIDINEAECGARSSMAVLMESADHGRIRQQLGPEAMVWAWQNMVYEGGRNNLAYSLRQFTDYDLTALERHRLSLWREFTNTDTRTLLQSYSFAKNLGGLISDAELKEALRSNTREGMTPSSKRIGSFQLITVTPVHDYPRGRVKYWHGLQVGENEVYQPWLDSPTGLMLLYRDSPEAMIGMTPTPHGLRIDQMQGVNSYVFDGNEWDSKVVGRGSPRGIFPFDLTGLLSTVGELSALNSGFERVEILGAENNRWTKPDRRGDIHMDVEEARAIYDKTALDRDYKINSQGNFELPLDKSVRAA